MDGPLAGLSASLLTALVTQLLCQLFKVAWYSAREGRLRLGWLFSAGGMPSAHSAFVTALTVSLALRHGPASDLFGLSVVFSLIVIYDSIRLRGAVQLHARLLRDLLQRSPGREPVEVPQTVGHTLPEVAAGVLAGAVVPVLVWRLL